MDEDKLIEEIKKHEIIYRKSSGGYKNFKKKSDAWTSIALELNLNEKLCQTGWKSLRDRYCRELRARQLPSGSAGCKNFKWEFFDSMSFLKDQMQSRKGKGNFDIVDDTVAENNFIESEEIASTSNNSANIFHENDIILDESELFNSSDSESDTFARIIEEKQNCTPTKKKIKLNNDIESKFIDTLDKFNTFFKKPTTTTTENDEEYFIKGAVGIMPSLQPFNREKAKAEIMSYLSKLKLNELYGSTNEVQL